MSYRDSPGIPFNSLDSSFSGRTSTSVASLLLELGDNHQSRIKAYQTFWNFYDGDHWSDSEFEATNVIFNYARTLVDVKSTFLSKNGFEVKIPEAPDDDGKNEVEVRNFVKNALDEQWKRNNKDIWLQKVVQMGAVTGDVWLRPSLDTSDPIEGKYIRIDILPSTTVFPSYDEITGKVTRIIIAFPVMDEVYQKQGILNRRYVAKKVERLYKEVWTAEHVDIYIDDELQESKENIFGMIPIVHIENFPNANGHYGISDLRDVIPIQRQLNEKATDISDIIDYHGSPVTVLFGARVDQLERGPDKIWQLPRKGDADIKNLELAGDLKANLTYLERVRTTMLDIARVPEQAINPTKNVSNTPGVALHMTYLPLIDDRRIKEGQYSVGIQEVNKLILYLLDMFDAEFSMKFAGLNKDTRYTTEVTFGEALPRDEILKLENQRSKLQMGLTTRKRILMEQGYGETDAQRIIEEANEELKLMAELNSTIKELKSTDTFGKTRRPDSVIQGDKISNQAATKAMSTDNDAG